MNVKVGDTILVHNRLKTKVEEVRGNKVFFYDDEGKKWHIDTNKEIKLLSFGG